MNFYLLGEAQALGLVVQVTLLDRLGLLLLLLLLGLSSLLSRLGLLNGLLLGSGSGLGGDNGCLLDRLGLSGSLDSRGGDASGLGLGLLGELDVLLFLGHFERFWGYQMRLGITTNKDVGIKKERKKEVNPEKGVGFRWS